MRSGNENVGRSSFTRCQANHAVRPNHSVNRTHCGGPPFGYKSLAQMPAHRNGPVTSNVKPQGHESGRRRNFQGSSQSEISLCSYNFAHRSHSKVTRFSIRYSRMNCTVASSSHARTLHVIATTSICASVCCGLTGRSTGHFAAVRVWASKA